MHNEPPLLCWICGGYCQKRFKFKVKKLCFCFCLYANLSCFLPVKELGNFVFDSVLKEEEARVPNAAEHFSSDQYVPFVDDDTTSSS